MSFKTKSGKNFGDHLKEHGLGGIEQSASGIVISLCKAIESFVDDTETEWDNLAKPFLNMGKKALLHVIDKIDGKKDLEEDKSE